MNTVSTRRLVYDIIVANHVTTRDAIFAILMFLGLLFLVGGFIFWGWRNYRQVLSKSRLMFAVLVPSCIGVLVASCALLSLVNFVTGQCDSIYYQWLNRSDYDVVDGHIEHLETKRKLLASDPIPTFQVHGRIFGYGVSSENFHLDTTKHGGVLEEGLSVEILFKDDIILQMYVTIPKEI